MSNSTLYFFITRPCREKEEDKLQRLHTEVGGERVGGHGASGSKKSCFRSGSGEKVRPTRSETVGEVGGE